MRFGPLPALAGFLSVTTSLFSTLAAAQDFDQAYCSNQNTGTTDKYYWQWQSNGECLKHCNGLGTYAFAVLKYTDCWCSNYIPASQTDISECEVDCPGFPSNKCGDRAKGLYMYIALGPDASGTQGAPSSTAPSSTMKTVTSDAGPTEPTAVPTVLTESGRVVTRTVISTPTSAPSRTDDESGSNTGAIVGGAVGGVLGVLAVVGGVLFILWRRRKQQREEQEVSSNGGSAGISRNVSTMSKSGLLGSVREKDAQYPSPIATNFGSQRSRYDNESGSPMTASDRRHSQPITVDSRLNPRAVLAFHGNDSRESIGTIDDSRDYGRQLNVVNPDLTHRD